MKPLAIATAACLPLACAFCHFYPRSPRSHRPRQPMSSRWPRCLSLNRARNASLDDLPRGQRPGIQRGGNHSAGGSDIILINEFDYEANAAS